MLHLLANYARSHGLEVEPGFAPKDVRWAIELAGDGRYLGVVELGDAAAKKNPGRQFGRCPDLSQPELVASRGRHFLVDSLAIVALHWQDEGKSWVIDNWDPASAAKEAPAEARGKLAAQHASFVGLLRGAAGSCPDLGVAARALDSIEVLREIGRDLRQQKAKSTDKATLRVRGSFPVESEAWHDWWRQYRASLGGKPPAGRGVPKASNRMLCFLSGRDCEPAATHQPVDGLADVGGTPMGDAVVSFDKGAFRSYGLDQGANAAVSETEVHAYRAALNSLLREHATRLAGAKVVHWYKSAVPPHEDPLPWLDDAGGGGDVDAVAQERARQLLDAIRSGSRPDLGSNEFYALTLSGCAGRVMVRDWMEGRFEGLLANVLAWFTHLEIARLGGLPVSPTFSRLVRAIDATRRKAKAGHRPEPDRSLPPIVSRLWRSAVRAEPISRQVAYRAAAYFGQAVVRGELIPNRRGEYDGVEAERAYARMALLRAYHVRKGDSMVDAILNDEHPSAAYHCGRLMAALAAVQRAALGDVGAGVVQRYYAAASTTPALVLGRLTRTAQFHLGKLEPGLARWFDLRLASIWGRLKAGPPVTLGLEDQSLFALGYYQQIAADEAARLERKANAKEGSSNE